MSFPRRAHGYSTTCHRPWRPPDTSPGRDGAGGAACGQARPDIDRSPSRGPGRTRCDDRHADPNKLARALSLVPASRARRQRTATVEQPTRRSKPSCSSAAGDVAQHAVTIARNDAHPPIAVSTGEVLHPAPQAAWMPRVPEGARPARHPIPRKGARLHLGRRSRSRARRAIRSGCARLGRPMRSFSIKRALSAACENRSGDTREAPVPCVAAC